MHAHVLRQIITPVESFTAVRHLANIFLIVLMLLDVPLAVVLTYKLAAAVVARVRTHRLVRVHVRYVVRVADKGSLAERAFERLAGSVGMRPPVKFQIPLGGEVLIADDAGVRFAAGVGSEMHIDG